MVGLVFWILSFCIVFDVDALPFQACTSAKTYGAYIEQLKGTAYAQWWTAPTASCVSVTYTQLLQNFYLTESTIANKDSIAFTFAEPNAPGHFIGIRADYSLRKTTVINYMAGVGYGVIVCSEAVSAPTGIVFVFPGANPNSATNLKNAFVKETGLKVNSVSPCPTTGK